jgi:ABC-2 type transport system ATP-binding protein
VQELTKRYGSVEAVRSVSFEVAGGTIFGLLGRNGAGKTTTLECLLGLRAPDAGRVLIDGVDALREPERARSLLGAQLQAATLQDKITPRQALAFFASFYAEAEPVDALLQRFALTAKADAPFDTLSGGQKQRLFLALALVHRPRVIVLDEPTAGLDPQARRELHDIIQQRRDDGATVILSTHSIEEAERLCDRVGILHNGSLVAVGAPAELVARVDQQSVITARPAGPLDASGLCALRGVSTASVRGTTLRLECIDASQALVSLAQHAADSGMALLDLRIQRPTLEDAFVALTGSRWDEEGAA